MNITQKLIPEPTQRRSGEKNLGITYIVCHDTGGDNSTALENVNYYIATENDIQASAHAFVDDLGVLECVPLDEKAWHVRYNAGIAPNVEGNFANDHAIGVELCYSTSGAFDSHKAYHNYCAYIASLLQTYRLDTTKLVQHAQLDPTRRTDPINAFSKIGKTWEMFLSDVALIINPNKHMEPTNTEEVSSQDGATKVEMPTPIFTLEPNMHYCMVTGFTNGQANSATIEDTSINYVNFTTDESNAVHELTNGTWSAQGPLTNDAVLAYAQTMVEQGITVKLNF